MGDVEELILKASFTPALVVLVWLAQRRWGDLVGGRLTALPLTSGPFVLIVVSGQGVGAGRAAAEGILAGTPTVVACCAGIRLLAARSSWREGRRRRLSSAWDLAVRVGITTAVVAGLSVVATVLDPRLAGVLATVPAPACVLAAMAHRRDGPAAAMALVRGVLVGLPSTALFFVVLAGWLGRLPVVACFGLAVLACLTAATVGIAAARRGLSRSRTPR